MTRGAKGFDAPIPVWSDGTTPQRPIRLAREQGGLDAPARDHERRVRLDVRYLSSPGDGPASAWGRLERGQALAAVARRVVEAIVSRSGPTLAIRDRYLGWPARSQTHPVIEMSPNHSASRARRKGERDRQPALAGAAPSGDDERVSGADHRGARRCRLRRRPPR